MIPPQLIDLIF